MWSCPTATLTITSVGAGAAPVIPIAVGVQDTVTAFVSVIPMDRERVLA